MSRQLQRPSPRGAPGNDFRMTGHDTRANAPVMRNRRALAGSVSRRLGDGRGGNPLPDFFSREHSQLPDWDNIENKDGLESLVRKTCSARSSARSTPVATQRQRPQEVSRLSPDLSRSFHKINLANSGDSADKATDLRGGARCVDWTSSDEEEEEFVPRFSVHRETGKVADDKSRIRHGAADAGSNVQTRKDNDSGGGQSKAPSGSAGAHRRRLGAPSRSRLPEFF